MGKTDKGVLIFCEWFEALNHLEPKTYKAVMNAAYRYQIYGEEPPQFKGKAQLVAEVIFPCLRRRTAQARGGKKAMEARYASAGAALPEDGGAKESELSPADEILQKRAQARLQEIISRHASNANG